MSCVTCEPKSMIRILSCMGLAFSGFFEINDGVARQVDLFAGFVFADERPRSTIPADLFGSLPGDDLDAIDFGRLALVLTERRVQDEAIALVTLEQPGPGSLPTRRSIR